MEINRYRNDEKWRWFKTLGDELHELLVRTAATHVNAKLEELAPGHRKHKFVATPKDGGEPLVVEAVNGWDARRQVVKPWNYVFKRIRTTAMRRIEENQI
jgi:hypothetical protein